MLSDKERTNVTFLRKSINVLHTRQNWIYLSASEVCSFHFFSSVTTVTFLHSIETLDYSLQVANEFIFEKLSMIWQWKVWSEDTVYIFMPIK